MASPGVNLEFADNSVGQTESRIRSRSAETRPATKPTVFKRGAGSEVAYTDHSGRNGTALAMRATSGVRQASIDTNGDNRSSGANICARSSTDRASDYGSEGWGFESLRARWVGDTRKGKPPVTPAGHRRGIPLPRLRSRLLRPRAPQERPSSPLTAVAEQRDQWDAGRGTRVIRSVAWRRNLD